MNTEHTLARLLARSIPEPNTGCWLWEGATLDMPRRNSTPGYGTISVDNEGWTTHRLSWLLHRAPIPTGMHVLHKCDTRPCVNPDHLFLGDARANALDMVRKGRWNGAHGVTHPDAKLSAADVQEIRIAPGLQREIASRFGVVRSTVSSIRSGKRWRGVGDVLPPPALPLERVCDLCGSVFRADPARVNRVLVSHVARCVRATPEERTAFQRTRRWRLPASAAALEGT